MTLVTQKTKFGTTTIFPEGLKDTPLCQIMPVKDSLGQFRPVYAPPQPVKFYQNLNNVDLVDFLM